MSNTWIGTDSAFDAPEYEEVRTLHAITCTLTMHGKYSALQSAALTPDGTTVVPGTSIPLICCRLQRAEGRSGKLIFEGKIEASASEGTTSTPDTVRVGLVWTPRQVPLERGRVSPLGSQYDYALLDFWKRTEDYRLKKEFKAIVPVIYGETPPLEEGTPAAAKYEAAQVEVHELNADTKLIAQRLALGMESYEDYYPVVTIRSTWKRKPAANVLTKPGTQGAPPLMPPGVNLSAYYWLCCAGNVEQTGTNTWSTLNAWTGLTAAARPAKEPQFWGDTPFDGLYYGAGTSGGGGK